MGNSKYTATISYIILAAAILSGCSKSTEPPTQITSIPTLFAGTAGGGVYRSTDNGDTWTQIDNGIPGTKTRVNAITINGTTVFIGASSIGVYRSTNNGDAWTESSAAFPASN